VNLSLKHYDQLETIPILQASSIVNNLICGGLIYQEFGKYSAGSLALLGLGFLICICGVLVIIRKNSHLAKQMMTLDESPLLARKKVAL